LFECWTLEQNYAIGAFAGAKSPRTQAGIDNVQLLGSRPFFLDLSTELNLRWQNLDCVRGWVQNRKQNRHLRSLIKHLADPGAYSGACE
jgi:hypothetical protein